MKKILLSISFLLLGILTLNAQYNQIYLVGSASPSGWTMPSPTAMTKDANNATIFTWKGTLKEGELKFATFSSDNWCGGDWILGKEANQSITNSAYATFTGCPTDDYKWKILANEAGYYLITINLTAQTVVFEATTKPYDNLYLVGDATAGLWDINAATEMTKNTTNDFIFSWEGTLKAGEFKIATTKTFDAGYDWLHPSTSMQTLCGTTYEIVKSGSGGTDFKWKVETEATYKITVDLGNKTILIGVPYTEFFIIGSAINSGWDLASAPYLTRDASSPFIFTWSGALGEGEFKFGTIKNFDAGDWMYATAANQSLTATDYDLRPVNSGTDNKWLVGANDVGNYTITLNLAQKTLTFVKDQTTWVSNILQEKILKNTIVENELLVSFSAKANYGVYSLNGSLLKSGVLTNETINLNNLQSGFYIFKIETNNGFFSEKFYKK